MKVQLKTVDSEAGESAQLSFRIKGTSFFLRLTRKCKVCRFKLQNGCEFWTISGRTHATIFPSKGPIYAAEETHMLINCYRQL